ncbi:hypothetical protein TNCV_970301 [Trichonephila clavipes]|nr:hypothetical protein TNCV_970301 [Trichonephila clavipes]
MYMCKLLILQYSSDGLGGFVLQMPHMRDVRRISESLAECVLGRVIEKVDNLSFFDIPGRLGRYVSTMKNCRKQWPMNDTVGRTQISGVHVFFTKKIGSRVGRNQTAVMQICDRRMQVIPPSAAQDQLWQNVEAAWSTIPQEYIQNLFKSMPRRLVAVISNNGGYSGY